MVFSNAYLIKNISSDRVSLCLAADKVFLDLEGKVDVVIGRIENYRNYRAVGVLEGNCFKLGSPSAASDALCALLNVLGEMSDIVISGGENVYTLFAVAENGSLAIKSAFAVVGRSVVLIKREVPIGRGVNAVFKTAAKLVCIAFAESCVVGIFISRIPVGIASLTADNVFIGPKSVY